MFKEKKSYSPSLLYKFTLLYDSIGHFFEDLKFYILVLIKEFFFEKDFKIKINKKKLEKNNIYSIDLMVEYYLYSILRYYILKKGFEHFIDLIKKRYNKKKTFKRNIIFFKVFILKNKEYREKLFERVIEKYNVDKKYLINSSANILLDEENFFDSEFFQIYKELKEITVDQDKLLYTNIVDKYDRIKKGSRYIRLLGLNNTNNSYNMVRKQLITKDINSQKNKMDYFLTKIVLFRSNFWY